MLWSRPLASSGVRSVNGPDADLIPGNAPTCPHCGFWCMIPWKTWWECPHCDGKRLPDATCPLSE